MSRASQLADTSDWFACLRPLDLCACIVCRWHIDHENQCMSASPRSFALQRATVARDQGHSRHRGTKQVANSVHSLACVVVHMRIEPKKTSTFFAFSQTSLVELLSDCKLRSVSRRKNRHKEKQANKKGRELQCTRNRSLTTAPDHPRTAPLASAVPRIHHESQPSPPSRVLARVRDPRYPSPLPIRASPPPGARRPLLRRSSHHHPSPVPFCSDARPLHCSSHPPFPAPFCRRACQRCHWTWSQRSSRTAADDAWAPGELLGHHHPD